MAQMRDIPTLILATEGNEIRTGVLSLLQKKGNKLLKSSDYELNPLYWRLVSYAGQTYLLGYSKQLPGAKATKKLLVKGCSTEMNLPEKAVVSAHSNETFLCIQCDEKIIFLKAESRSQRNKWVDAIRSVIKEPIYHSSTLSTTSTDSSDSFDVLRDRDRLPRSVHNTSDTAARPGTDFRRINTSPAGQFQNASNRSSVSSIPSSAQAMQQQQKRMANALALQSQQSQQSTIHSLNSDDRMRYPSQHDLDPRGIYGDGAQYTGFEYNSENDLSRMRSLSLSATTSISQPNLHVQVPVSKSKRLYTKRFSKSPNRHTGSGIKAFQQAEDHYGSNEPNYEPTYEPMLADNPGDRPPLPSPVDDNIYMPLKYPEDDQSSVSSVNNLGLERKGQAKFFLYDDTAAPPELPERDYQNLSGEDKNGLTKKKSSKQIRSPKPPQTPIEQMDSIEREKTVCLETEFERQHQPTGAEKSDDKETEMRGKNNSNTRETEPFHGYIQRFRSELFRKDGFIVEVAKIDLSPETIKLVCVADCICVAALPDAKLHSMLHVDDVIVKVNRQTLPSIDFCYKLFRTTDENKVQLHVKRVMHGVMCHVILPANGDVDSLGLEFGNQSQGNEVTAMHSEGLVATSGSPSKPQTHGVISGGVPVNWGLVEINKSPVSLDSSPAEVRDQLRRAGCELALVFVPVDIINVFKERSCEDRTDQAEGKC